jgi:cystathionine beta-lyase/cystathionine gamma-synthase
MTVPPETRAARDIGDALIRRSVGVTDAVDLISDSNHVFQD